MKAELIFIFLISISLFINAQVYQAGYTLSSYMDIIPDTVINFKGGTASNGVSNESYSIDISGDFQNDFEINAYSANGLGGGSDMIRIKSLNVYSYISFGRSDSVYQTWPSGFWWVTDIAKPLDYGDTINSVISKWNKTYLYITDHSYQTGAYKKVNDWIGITDNYIGIKYMNASDTIYGWIRINCPYAGYGGGACIVKDYSYSKSFTGIRDFEMDKFIVFPNPFNAEIYLENSEQDNIQLFDCLSRELRVKYNKD
jgi:hypothetical protein